LKLNHIWIKTIKIIYPNVYAPVVMASSGPPLDIPYPLNKKYIVVNPKKIDIIKETELVNFDVLESIYTIYVLYFFVFCPYNL
jgi:hypothetical protein